MASRVHHFAVVGVLQVEAYQVFEVNTALAAFVNLSVKFSYIVGGNCGVAGLNHVLEPFESHPMGGVKQHYLFVNFVEVKSELRFYLP